MLNFLKLPLLKERRAAIKLSVVQMPEQSDGHTCSDESFEVTDSKVTWR